MDVALSELRKNIGTCKQCNQRPFRFVRQGPLRTAWRLLGGPSALGCLRVIERDPEVPSELVIATLKTIDVRRPDQFQPRSMTRTLNRSRATDGSALSETQQASMRCFGQVAHERPLRASSGRSLF